MESMQFELNQAVTMCSTYSNLLTTGKFAYEGLLIQLKERSIEVHLDDILLAKGKSSDFNKITDSIDWTIFNTDPRIVDIFHTKVSNMSADLLNEYGNYN